MQTLHKKYPRPRVFSYSSLIKLHKKSTCFWKISLSFLETKNTSKYFESTHYASAQTCFWINGGCFYKFLLFLFYFFQFWCFTYHFFALTRSWFLLAILDILPYVKLRNQKVFLQRLWFLMIPLPRSWVQNTLIRGYFQTQLCPDLRCCQNLPDT